MADFETVTKVLYQDVSIIYRETYAQYIRHQLFERKDAQDGPGKQLDFERKDAGDLRGQPWVLQPLWVERQIKG